MPSPCCAGKKPAEEAKSSNCCGGKCMCGDQCKCGDHCKCGPKKPQGDDDKTTQTPN